MGDFTALLNGLHGYSIALGLALGLVGGFVFAMLTYRFYGRNFRNTFDQLSDDMKNTFDRLSSEALNKNQDRFLNLANDKFSDQTERHGSELESKKDLIDTKLQQMSDTLKAVPTELEKNQKNVTDALDKSTEQLEKSNQSYLNHLSDKAASQTKEHFTKLDDKETQINRRLGEMDKKLGDVQKLIDEFEKARESKLGALDDQLKNLTQTTSQLHRALADNRARGQWGERIAEDLLQLLGFVEGRNYFKQMTIASGERPDFTIILPNGLYVNMDVKYSFDNYDSYHGADSNQERTEFAKAFLRNVRKVVDDVANKSYINEDTVDCVLLLIPNEPVYRFIHEQDHTIMDTALRSKVVLCSPLNLYPVLAVIHQAAQSLAFERRSREVFTILAEIRAEWERYTKHMDGMEKNFATLERKFRELTGARTKQLDRRFDRIDTVLEGNALDSDLEGAKPQLPDGPVKSTDDMPF